jgi:UDP:flavonoid glycosyltransferase YjiC (YdhE family)
LSNQPATVVFFPEGAYGPTNNCVGIGNVLRERGHRVVFIIEESFAGTLAAQGFEERLMRLGPPAETEEVPGQFWKDFIRDTAPVFRTPTIDQLGTFIAPTFEALIGGAKHVDDRLREIIDELAPDVIVEDNVVAFPALPASGRPWVRIVSCNPAEIKDPDVPPPFSGYPAGDRSEWDAYRAAYREAHAALHADFDAFCTERGAPPLPDLEFIHESPWLNLYLYPGEIDYPRAHPLGATWHNLHASVRNSDAPYEIPEPLSSQDGALIYLSLGSLGSADVELMRKLVAELADRPPPGDRVQGPPARRVRARRQHGRSRVPAADLDPPARRPRDHPRRQQHGHRIAVLRQADDRPAAVLGPVRQRAAGA